MNANDISLSQLADPGFANQGEIDAIVAIHPQLKSSQKEALAVCRIGVAVDVIGVAAGVQAGWRLCSLRQL
jgi:hypothetical protein